MSESNAQAVSQVGLTFENVDAQLKAVGPLKAPISKAEASANLCGYYKAARPILQFVGNFPFFPASWKAAVVVFIQALDFLCPQQ